MTLPHGWTSRRFDQLGELCSGSTPSSSRTEFWDGATVWVTPTDLSRLSTPYLHDSAKHITERGLRNCSARLLPPGSIVLSSRAPIGYVAIPTVPFCTNQGCKSIELHDSYHSEFVYYAVTAAVPRLKRLGEGTTFAEISKSSLGRAEVVLPIDRAEQAKIAEVLSTVDRAIEQTEALIAKQQRIKTGLTQDLLTRGIDEHGNLRSEQTHKFKDSPLGRIPVEWDVATVDQIASVTTGDKDTQDADSSAEYPFFVRSQTIKKISSYSFDGEAVLTAGDGVGTGKVFHYFNGRFDFHQRVYCIHSFTDDMLGYYFFCHFQTHFMAQVAQFSAKGSVDSVRRHMIAKMLVPKPGRDEQAQLVNILRSSAKTIDDHTAALRKIRHLKAGLMQDLLTGDRRVTALLGSPKQAVGA